MIWIIFPNIRDNVFTSFKYFGRSEEQNIWYEYLGDMLETLGDCRVEDIDGAKSSLIHIFYIEDEVNAVYQFNLLLNDFLKDTGRNKSNDVYLNHHLWKELCNKSNEIFEMMDDNDKKYSFSICYEKFCLLGLDKYIKYAENQNDKAGQKYFPWMDDFVCKRINLYKRVKNVFTE